MKAHCIHPINGILLLDKPLHMSSNAALQRAKRLYKAKKAGHTGSLDPLATGMLPICFGEATKFSQFLLDSDKSYIVHARLGIKTTTGDAEGDIICQKPASHIKQAAIEKILPNFLGTTQQIPPMYSALKHQGKPLYELARSGIEIPRAARTIHIYSLELMNSADEDVCLQVTCSKGTYIRTLVEDIGDQLGCGASVRALRRVYVHPYQQVKMLTFEELENIAHTEGEDGLKSVLLLPETSLASLPSIQLSISLESQLKKGQIISVPHASTSSFVRLFSEENYFLGLGEILLDGRIKPKRLIHTKQ